MSWKVFLTSSLLVFFLLGCVSAPPNPNLIPTTITRIEYVAYNCGEPPGVTPVSFQEFRWKLKKVGGTALWTLTAEEYERLGDNMTDIILAVTELVGERNFYEDCVERSLERLENHNKNNGLVPDVDNT
jgi:hypothetical protein